MQGYSLGLTPAVALFATNGRYKREAYRGSEFAPRILADNDLRVVMKVCMEFEFRPHHINRHPSCRATTQC